MLWLALRPPWRKAAHETPAFKVNIMSNLIRWRDEHHMLPLVLAASFTLLVAIAAHGMEPGAELGVQPATASGGESEGESATGARQPQIAAIVKDIAPQRIAAYVDQLVGSLMLSTVARNIPAGRIMISFTFVWYAMLLVYSYATLPVLGVALLMLAGFMQSLSMVPMAVMLLRSAEPRFRGRVMGVRMLAVYGMPLGLLLAGWLIQRFGFVATATAYCLFGLLATGAIALIWRQHLFPLAAPANGR